MLAPWLLWIEKQKAIFPSYYTFQSLIILSYVQCTYCFSRLLAAKGQPIMSLVPVKTNQHISWPASQTTHQALI